MRRPVDRCPRATGALEAFSAQQCVGRHFVATVRTNHKSLFMFYSCCHSLDVYEAVIIEKLRLSSTLKR